MFRAALLLVFACAAGFPQEVTIRCGKLLDIKSGQYLSNVTVAVKDGRITSVGAGGSIPAIDLSRATCLPGLIDVHEHITGDARMPACKGLGVSVPALGADAYTAVSTTESMRPRSAPPEEV